jgi:hypothetical protein
VSTRHALGHGCAGVVGRRSSTALRRVWACPRCAGPGCALRRARYRRAQRSRATGGARHRLGRGSRARAAAVPALRARIPHARSPVDGPIPRPGAAFRAGPASAPPPAGAKRPRPSPAVRERDRRGTSQGEGSARAPPSSPHLARRPRFTTLPATSRHDPSNLPSPLQISRPRPRSVPRPPLTPCSPAARPAGSASPATRSRGGSARRAWRSTPR